jgi:hypothetical protein
MGGWLQHTSAAQAPRYTFFGMKKHFHIPILAATLLLPALAQTSANPFLGRWDLTVTGPRNSFPDWLEVTEKDGALTARYGITGGALDANEGDPGPFFLQGDHGPITYRNITISTPKN